MNKTVLGLDLGSNSLGWALLEEKDGRISRIIGLGCRIFTRAVEDKTPTPKNVERRNKRLGRRVLQRRARRKQRMLNYLISLKLLPVELRGHPQPEALLNELGDPWELRVKALDRRLEPHEFGRVLLHFVQRRGFLSSKKQLAGDLVDDPDTIAYLDEIDENPSQDKEESDFKADIAKVRDKIRETGARTLGEYLYKLEKGKCKRNRSRAGGHLRTERKMYEEELDLIWETQRQYFSHLPDDFMDKDKGIKQIIFYQRPLKLKKDRVGKCSLEPKNNRAAMARLEAQRFRYLCDLNHLTYSDEEENNIRVVDKFKDSEKLLDLKDEFEGKKEVTFARIKKILGLGKKTKFNLEAKELKGNITAYEIKTVLGERWNDFSGEQQKALVEDLLSIRKKSALKTRLLTHWKFDKEQAVKLCLLEFEPSHSNHSLKAINKLLPYLKEGLKYSKAREEAGYGYKKKKIEIQDALALGAPPPTSNPIVNRGLHELKRVINAIIKQHGKPDVIRIEMARDLEMNTKRYKENEKRQNKNKTENEEATDKYRELGLGQYPNRDAKIKYRLWKEQNHLCAYSNRPIPEKAVFTAEVEIDHILPYKKSLDDSYMNKVLCYTEENRNKGDRTPKDAWEGNKEKWEQITQAIKKWKGLDSKVKRFYQTEADLQERNFIASQLNDTRYIARLSLGYVKELVCDVSVTKGYVVSEIRHQWGLNNLIGETDGKERTDHRHHTIDAACIAATSRSLYTKAVKQIKKDKLEIPEPYPNFRDELAENLKHLIVSHASQRKLSGSLHEDTGANYIEKHGGTVYRKNLDTDFTQAKKIIDDTIRELVLAHLEKYGNNPKEAFADSVTVYHKDKKTPIKRVRILQSITTQEKLEKDEFGVKDGSGKVFKWMPYGNMHHVEIIKHKETGEYKGEFVTMMQASHRAKGVKSELNPDGTQQPMVRTEHGDEWQFIMALHINDTVSIETGAGEREFYRVQNLEKGSGSGKIKITHHTSAHKATKIPEEKTIRKAVTKLMSDEYKLRKHFINVIGMIMDDKKDY